MDELTGTGEDELTDTGESCIEVTRVQGRSSILLFFLVHASRSRLVLLLGVMSRVLGERSVAG